MHVVMCILQLYLRCKWGMKILVGANAASTRDSDQAGDAKTRERR